MSNTRSQEKQKALIQAIETALEKAPTVDNEIDLKSAVKMEKQAIISSEKELYARMLKKVPREKAARKTKKAGKFLTALGAVVSVGTGGILAWIGVPIAAAGIAIGGAGLVLEEYKGYSIFLDYDNQKVIFIKTKGANSLRLPENFDQSKYIK